MKKKILIIQSIVLVLVTALMFSVVTFAWLVAGTAPKLNAFDVSVVGRATISYKFFTKADNNTYVETTELNSFIIGEQIVPGVPVWRRIDITNLSNAPINIAIEFNGITYKPQNFTCIDKTQKIENFFVVQSLLSATSVEPANDVIDTPTNTTEFLTHIVDEKKATSFNMTLAPSRIEKSSTACIFYRFYVKREFAGIDGATFDLTASGLKFTADLIN